MLHEHLSIHKKNQIVEPRCTNVTDERPCYTEKCVGIGKIAYAARAIPPRKSVDIF